MSDYEPIARLYDAEHADFCGDIELYRNFCLRCNGAVLELGCGSGRVTVPLAESGHAVTGVDVVPAMLELARERAERAGVQDLVQLENRDVRTLSLPARFSLAIFPLNGFLHLPATQDQLDALASIRRALLPGGLLIVDLPNPHAILAPDRDGQMMVRRRFRLPGGGGATSWTTTRTDMASQVQHLYLSYDVPQVDGDVRRTSVEMDLRFVYRYEMEGLLRESGFVLDDVYGNYELDPYQDGSESMLFVAYRKK